MKTARPRQAQPVKRHSRLHSDCRAAGALASSLPRVRKILIPLDFSSYSNFALNWALSLAQQYQAATLLLYVAETKPAGAEFGLAYLPHLERDLRNVGCKQLASIREAQIPASIRCQYLIRAGKADVEIVRTAKMMKADLIVMATHSTQSEQGQLGSTCERVTRFSHCPVLLVPAHDEPVPFFL